MKKDCFFLPNKLNKSIFCLYENAKEANDWVVCCHGPFQDKAESWFVLSKISEMAQKLGFSVGRYDAYGCGDSAGTMEDIRINNMAEDAEIVTAHIISTYKPRNTVFVGVGLGNYFALKTAQHYNANDVMMINPTMQPFFGVEQVISGGAEPGELIDLTERVIEYKNLEILHDMGSQYWNVLGQRVTPEFLKDITDMRLERLLEREDLQWAAIISSTKETDIELLNTIITGRDIIYKIDSSPLFTDPRAQDKVIRYAEEYLKSVIQLQHMEEPSYEG